MNDFKQKKKKTKTEQKHVEIKSNQIHKYQIEFEQLQCTRNFESPKYKHTNQKILILKYHQTKIFLVNM